MTKEYIEVGSVTFEGTDEVCMSGEYTADEIISAISENSENDSAMSDW